jgi:hypothetical protein
MKTIVRKPLRLVNNRSGEEWLCDDYHQVRNVDGTEFVEVYKENTSRKFWMNKATLVKAKKNLSKKN